MFEASTLLGWPGRDRYILPKAATPCDPKERERAIRRKLAPACCAFTLKMKIKAGARSIRFVKAWPAKLRSLEQGACPVVSGGHDFLGFFIPFTIGAG